MEKYRLLRKLLSSIRDELHNDTIFKDMFFNRFLETTAAELELRDENHIELNITCLLCILLVSFSPTKTKVEIALQESIAAQKN